MAISKDKKQQQLIQLKELITRSEAVVFSNYRGLTASQMAELRNKLRPFNSTFMVAKNSIVSRSLDELGLPQAGEMLKGPTALTFCFEDITAPARTMAQFGTETRILSVKGGLLGARIIDAGQVQTLATLPAQPVLLAETLGTLQSPLSSLVGVLDGALRSLLYVLDARAEQLGETAAA